MKIVIQNVVRDPSTHEIRRRNPGSVTPSPVIAGAHLPPRRSRNVDTSVLQPADVRYIIELISCGVVRVFSASPFAELSESHLRGLLSAEVAAPEVAAPPPVVETPPAPPEPIAVSPAVQALPVEEPTVEDPEVAPESPTWAEDEGTPGLRESLLELTNAKLRAKLAEVGGGNGTGLSKSQLVDAILERIA